MKKWNKNFKETKNMAGAAGAGAVVGFVVGAFLGGPVGAIVGTGLGAAGVGGASIALDSNDKPPKLPPR